LKIINTQMSLRLNTISAHIQPPTMENPTRPFITCHVLDTVLGKPGVGIAVELRLLSPSPAIFPSSPGSWTARTNSDGRVSAWESSRDINTVVSELKAHLREGEHMVWSLTFETEAYYGIGKTFWPQVELRFAAKKEEEHYHVPLLLGPWSYTTYRGS
jgi:5-hydroxyisourate hydrolase